MRNPEGNGRWQRIDSSRETGPEFVPYFRSPGASSVIRMHPSTARAWLEAIIRVNVAAAAGLLKPGCAVLLNAG
jgi:hypothetical protein